MKEIKEEIKREITDVHTYYEALDGTRFTNSEECRKYDESALCVAKAKIKALTITNEHNAWDFMGGYEDNSVFGIRVSSPEDADIIKHWLLLDHPYLQEDKYKEGRDRFFTKIDSAIGDLLLMGINCDGDWYIINSRKAVLNNLENLDKEEPENSNR